MKRTQTYLLVFLLSISSAFSQVDNIQFLKDFKAADRKGKVKLVASVNFCELKGIYPQLKDTLDLIRRKIFTNSSSKEAKFLFDKIDVSMYQCNKQYSKAAILLESCLSSHVRDIYDSLYCYLELKEAFVNLNNLNKAVEASTFYDKLATRTKDKNYLSKITKKSKIYDVFGLNQQAIVERRKEFLEEYAIRRNDTDFLASYNNDQGVYFNRIKRSDSAIPYFKRASELITKKLSYSQKKDHYQFFKGLIEGNMAFAYTNVGEYKKALPYLKSDIYYSKRVNDLESAFNSCVLLSECYINLDQLNFARQYVDSAEQINSIYTKPRMKLKLLYLQGELMDAFGNSSQAVNKFKAYMSLKDSLSNRDKELQLINQQVALDIQKKDTELSEKSELIKNSIINEGKQKVFRAYLMTGLIITIILIGFLFYTNKNSKNARKN
ncbi:MAG: hypothetical protein IPJ60_04775 [Sphingobacteriaceae bacterium]|nr:hypothetical protein [Sphingobacteriaceae bacterium]